MESHNIFISSCSRRELARRRPMRKSLGPRRSGFSEVGSGAANRSGSGAANRSGSGAANRSGFGAGASRGRRHGLVAGFAMPATVLGVPLLVLAVALVAVLAIAGRF
jgi:hypothetical protein